MIDAKVGRGSSNDFKLAVGEATKDFVNPKLIVYFTSKDNFEAFTRLLHEKFPDTTVIGCSAYREICSKGLTNGSLLAMSFESGIECSAGVISDIDTYPVKHIRNVKDCIDKIGNIHNTVCLEFCVGLTNAEEKVLSTLNSLLHENDIPLFGATSADNGEAKATYVGLNGSVYNNHCVFVLIKNLNGKIKLYRENIYTKTNKKFIATKVDTKNRIVYELNGKPCAEVIRNSLNVPMDNLNSLLGTHPLGRIVGDAFYISSSNTILKDNSISYASKIYRNSQVSILEPTDYKQVLRNTISEILNDFKDISCSIVVNCTARTILFENDGFAESFANQLGELGTYIGLASFGEQYNDYHLNQTMVIAVFE